MIGFGIPHGMELLIVLAVVLLLFGHRLPGMARSLGSGITEFKRGLKDGGSSDKDGDGSSSSDSSGDSSKTSTKTSTKSSSNADSDSSGSR